MAPYTEASVRPKRIGELFSLERVFLQGEHSLIDPVSLSKVADVSKILCSPLTDSYAVSHRSSPCAAQSSSCLMSMSPSFKVCA